MLRRFYIKNFYSVRDGLELSLLQDGNAPEDFRSSATIDAMKVSKTVALIGANGSGKTNILKMLAFIQWFVSESFGSLSPDERIPVKAHFAAPDEPIELKVEFELDGKIWLYHLLLTEQRVLHEALYRKGYRFAYIFKRDWNGEANRYDFKLKEEFGLTRKEAAKTRKNASLLSTAAQYDEPLARRLTRLNIYSNVNEMGKYSFSDMEQLFRAARYFNESEEEKGEMSRLLADWDLGLDSTYIREETIPNKNGDEETLYIPVGRYRVDEKLHELTYLQESSGTRAAFVLLSRLLPVLRAGGLAVIDELEGDLHPHMLSAILDLFFSPATNPRNAQILFSTHSHELMNNLHKGQIVLVEKDKQLHTQAYRLDDVENVRSDDNFYKKYMAGAYGAIPEL